MKYNEQHWNNIYKNLNEKKPAYDLWLDKYKDILDKLKGQCIIDLGCGAGRVNSINDINYGAGNGVEIEKNFYLTEEGYKRFFNKDDIYNYFSDFKIEVYTEETIHKYTIKKKAFEFVAGK